MKPLITIVCLMAFVGSALADGRPAPYLFSDNYTGPEIAALEAQAILLEEQIDALTTQIEQLKQQGKDASGEEELLAAREKELIDLTRLPEDIRELNASMIEFCQSELERLVPDRFGEKAITLENAKILGDLLFTDWGQEKVNYRWQSGILSGMVQASQHPRISPEVCKVLRDISMEYYQGVRAHYPDENMVSPMWMSEMSEALLRLSEPDDIDARAAATKLCQDTVNWADALERPTEASKYRATLKNLVDASDEIQLVGPDLAAGYAKQQVEIVLSSGKTAKMSLEEARRRIEFLLRRFNWDIDKVREITDLGLANYGVEVYNVKMRKVLFEAYARILVQSPDTYGKAENAAKIISHIDASLLTLAEKNQVPDDAWSKWAVASSQLGARASDKMKKFVLENTQVKKRSSLKIACDRVSSYWAKSRGTKNGPQASSVAKTVPSSQPAPKGP